MRRRGPAAAGALLMLAATGCDQGPPPEQRPPTKIVNPYHDQLAALPAELRYLALTRAIRDNGKRCRNVEAGRYQQDYLQMAMWVALCDDGRHWAIFIAPNGDTQLRECVHMRRLGLPQCRPVTGPGAPPAAEGAPKSG